MIYEDRDDCYSTIAFSYKGDGTAEIFNAKIQRVDLYVFDANDGTRVVNHTLTEGEIEAQSAQVLLPPGKQYRAVCVGNAHETEIINTENSIFNDMRFLNRHTHQNNHHLMGSHDSLYHGNRIFDIPAEGQARVEVPLNSSHIDVSVEVIGYHDTAVAAESGTRAEDGLPLNIAHSEVPEWTDFENRHSKHESHAEPKTITQYPHGKIANGNYLFEYNVMKDIKGSKIELLNSTQTEVLKTIDVNEFLAEAEASGKFTIDFDKQEIVLPIQIEFKNGEVIVDIAPWAVQNVNPEF